MLVACGTTGYADDTMVGREADGVYPMANAEVEMVAEDVTISASGDARCVFTFHNTSDQAVGVLMGFPCEFTAEELLDVMTSNNGSVLDFHAYVDDAEVSVAAEKGSRGPESVRDRWGSWYTFTVSFAPDQVRTVVNTYQFDSTRSATGSVDLGYVLRTGSYWKGPIGQAKVTVQLGNVQPWQIASLFPNSWRFSPDGSTLTWERSDFEPSFDLWIRFNDSHWSAGYLGNVGQEYAQQFFDRQAAWQDLLARAPGLGQDELLDLYSGALAEPEVSLDWEGGGGLVRAAYLRSLLSGYEWKPPSLADPEVTFNDRTTNMWAMVKVAYSDPDGDIVRVTIRGSHTAVDGTTIVDEESTSDYRDWRYMAPRPSGTAELRLSTTPGCLYTFTAEVEDSQGLTASDSINVTAPPLTTGAQPQSQSSAQPASPSIPGPATAAPGRQAPILWFIVGGAGLVLLVVTVVVARRSGRHRRERANGAGD